MISILLALAAQAAPASDEASYKSCIDQVQKEPEKAAETASEWRIKGGGILSRLCLGQAYVALERWAPAATAFEQAALDAEREKDDRRADFWVQSGNSWLAAGDAVKARKALDSALATGLLTPELRGEAHLDRARAGVAMNDLAGARADLQKGLELVPSDPFAWYLSSALAQQEGNLARARSDIAKAVELAPDDAEVLLHAGNVAGLDGDVDAARGFYLRAARAGRGTDTGRSAEAALAANPAPATDTQPK